MRRQAEKAEAVVRLPPAAAHRRAGRRLRGRGPAARRPLRDAGQGVPLRRRGARTRQVVLPPDEVQDFVIRKGDGMPTYHFAVVVDDAEMGVTHVLRGQEHLLNTFNHIALQEALGYPPPGLRPPADHHEPRRQQDGQARPRQEDPPVGPASGSRARSRRPPQLAAAAALIDARGCEEWLADDKKQLDLDEQAAVMNVIGLKQSDLPEILVHDFRKNGYLPEALLNFLALLGWSPGGDRERMSMDEMVQPVHARRHRQEQRQVRPDQAVGLQHRSRRRGRARPAACAAMRDYLAVNPDSPLNDADDATLAKLLHMKKGFRAAARRGRVDPPVLRPRRPDRLRSGRGREGPEEGRRPGAAVLREVRHVLDAVDQLDRRRPGRGGERVRRAEGTRAWARSPSRSAWPSAAPRSARRSSRAWSSSAGSGRSSGSTGACHWHLDVSGSLEQGASGVACGWVWRSFRR